MQPTGPGPGLQGQVRLATAHFMNFVELHEVTSLPAIRTEGPNPQPTKFKAFIKNI